MIDSVPLELFKLIWHCDKCGHLQKYGNYWKRTRTKSNWYTFSWHELTRNFILSNSEKIRTAQQTSQLSSELAEALQGFLNGELDVLSAELYFSVFIDFSMKYWLWKRCLKMLEFYQNREVSLIPTTIRAVFLTEIRNCTVLSLTNYAKRGLLGFRS